MAKKKGADKPAAPAIKITPRLQTLYFTTIQPQLAASLGRTNVNAVPRLTKIICSMGVGSAVTEKKHLEDAVEALGLITGQKPLVTRARQSIAGFRLREGLPIGCKVTLRGARMYEFLDRLLSFALPRVRDFRGVNPEAFDGRGNYSLGLSEYLVFAELNPDKFIRSQGLNIAIVTTARNDDEARELLRLFGMPFRQGRSDSEAA